MQIQVFDTTGKKQTPWTLDEKALGKVNNSLLAQALRVYEDNSHQGGSQVKTRGEVVGSTRKIYRQKGTGRARHGARYAPIFVGGGIAHGPTGLRATNLVLPKKMRRGALKSAILLKLQQQEIAGLFKLTTLDGKTSSALSLLSQIAGHPKKTTLIITEDKVNKLYQAVSNLQGISVRRSSLVNAYDLVRADFVVLTKKALDSLLARATGTSKVPAKQATKEQQS